MTDNTTPTSPSTDPATSSTELSRDRRRRGFSGIPLSRRTFLITGTAVALAIVSAAVVGVTGHGDTSSGSAAAQAVKIPAGSDTPLTAEQVASLPAAVYSAVIPGLIAYTSTDTTGITHAATLQQDTPVYGEGRKQAVARLLAKDFLKNSTTVVPIRTDGPWTLVLTPARQQLPSKASGAAAAQTAGWVRTDALRTGAKLPSRVTVSVSKQTLTINTSGRTVSYKVGVGTPATPTPENVTGYFQARYLDPKQGEDIYPIQLTSLHSAATDEPFGGSDGGLIGVHYQTTTTGAVSHGCVRLTAAAIAAVNQLPLGTPITITK